MMHACLAMMSFVFASAVICGGGKGAQLGVSKSIHWLSKKISIQSSLELRYVERNYHYYYYYYYYYYHYQYYYYYNFKLFTLCLLQIHAT